MKIDPSIDLVVLLSFPRSGLHFVMYIIQFLTRKVILSGLENRETFQNIHLPDYAKIRKFFPDIKVDEKNLDVSAVSQHFSREPKYSADSNRIMLILRDPVEAILSHFEGISNEINDTYAYVREASEQILKNLQRYDICKKSKCIVVYEDLVFNDTVSVVKQIGQFFEVSNEKIDLLLQDLDKHRRDSLQLMVRKGTSNSPNFYASQLTEKDLKMIKSIVYDVLDHPIIKKLYVN